jgi:probable rRNA maturation factor
MACDDAQIAQLNKDFRGKPQPTNVLSWPSEELSMQQPGAQPKQALDPELGDIAIAYETCVRESHEAGLAFVDHLTHLLLHGLLHLLGYDHIDDADADVMEGLEIKMLASLGISNPYIMYDATQ